MGTFAGHTDGITYIDTKDDSRHIITNSKDQSIKLWDLRKFASKRSIEQTRKAVRNQNWDYRWARFPGMYKYIYIVLKIAHRLLFCKIIIKRSSLILF